MRVLFDHHVPIVLAPHLDPYKVATADGMGWAAIAKGQLLANAEAEGFEIITADQNLAYQQNLSRRKIGIIVLGTNHWPTLRKNPQLVSAAVASLPPGGFCRVEFD